MEQTEGEKVTSMQGCVHMKQRSEQQVDSK
jgi:hypothetical protein